MGKRIYLSGSVKKGSGDGRGDGEFWTERDENVILAGLNEFDVALLNPSKTPIRRSDYIANYGCDLFLVGVSDVMLVDCRTRKGIGIGAEMMYAQSRGIPVVTVCPRNSEYRRDLVTDVAGEDLVDWVHPFVAGLSDHVVESIEESIPVVARILAEGTTKRPNDSSEAVAHFLATQGDAVRHLRDR